MGKYIVELKKNETLYKAATRESDGTAYVYSAIGTPYTEPDLEQVKADAYNDGYKAGREAEKVRQPDLEQARKEAYQNGYRRALADVREENVCQTCVYFDRDENEEPCIRCPHSFIDQYTPKQERDAEIKVGDEVEFYNGEKRVVLVVEDGKPVKLLEADGYTITVDGDLLSSMKKTGRQFPEIASVLEKMRGEHDE